MTAGPATAQDTARASLADLEASLVEAQGELATLKASETATEREAVEARDRLLRADRAVAGALDVESRAKEELAAADEELAAADAALDIAQQELDAAEAVLEETTAALEAQHELLIARIRSQYMTGSSLGFFEMIMHMDDYDDLVQAKVLADLLIERDNDLVVEWLDVQARHEAAVEEADAARSAHDAARARARTAADAAAEKATAAAQATAGARREQERRAMVLGEVEGSLVSLNVQRIELEERIEGLQAAITAEEARLVRVAEQREEERRAEEAAAAAAARARREAAQPDPEPDPVPPPPPPAPDPEPDPEPEPEPDPEPDPEPEPQPEPPPTGGAMCSSSSSWVWPTSGCVSSGYGPRISPTPGASSFHMGIDIPAPSGQSIVAVAAGRVWRADYSSSHGYVTVIDHGGGIYSLYAHQRRLPPVSVGQWVTAGQLVGEIGTTGISTGNHLHFEVHVGCMYGCSRVDPADWFGH